MIFARDWGPYAMLNVHPLYLQIQESQKILRMPFAPPVEGQPQQSADLRRRLSAQRRFVPWGGGTNFVPMYLQAPTIDDEAEDEAEEDAEVMQGKDLLAKAAALVEPEAAPLVLWEPGEEPKSNAIVS
jgi:hypothetical protein